MMTKALLPAVEERLREGLFTEVRTHGDGRKAGQGKRMASLMTPIGVVEGEILNYLEDYGSAKLEELIRDLEWSAHLILMGVGSLIRQGFIRGIEQDLGLILESRHDS